MVTSVLVIENVGADGTEWGISFTDFNPEDKDYFKMTDKDTAFRLKDRINCISPNPSQLAILEPK